MKIEGKHLQIFNNHCKITMTRITLNNVRTHITNHSDLQKISVYDQEIPQSHTTDQPTTP